MGKNIVVGSQVSLLRETGIYTVCKIENSTIFVTDEFGFDYKFLLTDVIVRNEIKVDDKLPNKDQPTNSKSVNSGNKLHEIDLHFDQISSTDKGYSAHEKLTLQIKTFKNFFNEMLKKRQTRFVVVHGAGQGKLKEELTLLVRGKEGVGMHDNNYSNGKVGSSLIEIQISKATEF